MWSSLRQAGFTLIEVMIVVAIISIISAIAYPAYTSQIAKGRRAECRSGLLQMMQQEERYFTQYNTYLAVAEGATGNMKAFSGDSAATSSCLMTALPCASPAITGTRQASSTLSLCVEIQGRMLTSNANIGYLAIDSNGVKGCTVSGTAKTSDSTCWP